MERVKAEIWQSFVREDGLGGNPAGVVIHNGSLTREQMQVVARKLDVSETAFVEHVSNRTKLGCYQVLFYTPDGSQVSLCGHATIAAGGRIFTSGDFANQRKFSERYERSGRWCETEVRMENDMIFYQQEIPSHTEYLSWGGICDSLGLTYEDFDERFDPTKILTDALIALEKDSLERLPAEYPVKDLRRALDDEQLQGVHLFALGKGDPVAQCRNLAPAVGINEEAATGSVTGLLAHVLRNQSLLTRDQLQGALMRFEQGETEHTPASNLFVRFKGEEVWVGGRVRKVREQKIDL
ncbi:PhzF family phenazine biosynthesis protein [Candidatus Peregrinibacteria bacterium]|nr:PhzF family phenazine biosynthesis protein [Candidatus Peregrinibacteria bacterium]